VNSSTESSSAKHRVVQSATTALAANRASSAEPLEDLAKIIDGLPADDAQTGYRVCQKLLAGGAATIARLVEMAGDEFGDPNGAKAKYALLGLVIYSSRPGAERDRKLVAGALARELSADHSKELKAFVCRQLQLCGGPGEVPALARLLTDEQLCEPATQSLLAIGGDQARGAIRNALPRAKGKPRATIIKALGRMRDQRSADAIRGAVNDPDQDIRLVAIYTLGNMGDAGSIEVLLKAAHAPPSYERDQATDATLLLGRRLAEAGNPKAAEKVFRDLLKARHRPEDVHHRCGALRGLALARGAKAVGDVLRALDSSDLKYRAAAARTALDLARMIQKNYPAEAKKLLNKIPKATEEKAVIQKAGSLLGKA
jgi:hypothetical protein